MSLHILLQVDNSFHRVDGYIKAFYLPWEDMHHWAHLHVAELGKPKVMLLLESMAEAHSIKKQDKLDLFTKLERELHDIYH